MDLEDNHFGHGCGKLFGEDVYLASQMGSSYIKGAQGNDIGAPDKLATCLKHYVGYSFPINGLDRTPAWISERMLREYFYQLLKAGILAGASTVWLIPLKLMEYPGMQIIICSRKF